MRFSSIVQILQSFVSSLAQNPESSTLRHPVAIEAVQEPSDTGLQEFLPNFQEMQLVEQCSYLKSHESLYYNIFSELCDIFLDKIFYCFGGIFDVLLFEKRQDVFGIHGSYLQS